MSRKKAVIYARVSSTKQMVDGDGLNSQVSRCAEYAKRKGYEVVKTFKDDVSGALTTRPAMKAMLQFLRRRRKDPHIVIIDDISRLARNIEAHLQLRAAIGGASGVLESPTMEFGDDSDSLLVENLLASVSQHQRQKNAEQTKNRMIGRTMNGYWVFHAPYGYRYQAVKGHGKLLVRDEPLASVIQEALEGYASGRFESQTEVKRFMEQHNVFPKTETGENVRYQKVNNILKKPIYAGLIEVHNWGVTLRQGHHEGLISVETYERIQERLTATTKAPARKDLSLDFPLRGFITCDDCKKPLTACWSKGKTKSYPYYLCNQKGCVSKGKSIPKHKLEGEFDELLKTLVPSNEIIEVSAVMFKDAWNMRIEQVKAIAADMMVSIKKIDQKIKQLVDRVLTSKSQTVVNAYENQINELEKEREMIKLKQEKQSKPERPFSEMFELAMDFLSNPRQLWVSDKINDKRTVLKLTFGHKLAYNRQTGYRTPKMSLPFKMLRDLKTFEKEMVPRARIELALPKKPDFESGASTNSATPAQAVKYIRFLFYGK